jgi:hypothetical protein
MPRENTRIERLKAVKSAYILEARTLTARNQHSAAMPLFLRAGEMEIRLARLFRSREDENNARISLLSAGSCFIEARQYRRAIEPLREVVDQLPEARKLIAQCTGQEDAPLTAGMPELQALIDLLVEKGLIEEGDWAKAIANR